MPVRTIPAGALPASFLPAARAPQGTAPTRTPAPPASPPATSTAPTSHAAASGAASGEVFPADALPAGAFAWGPKGLPVPHAVVWSGEQSAGRGLYTSPRGLAYQDEKPGDRDRHGVLWARVSEQPGVGKPDFAAMHPVRQREAMLGLHCQVCGGPADRTSKGWLFLLPRREAVERDGGMLVSKPPVCAPCADLAMRWCPHLGDCVALRSRKPRVWGVSGELITPKGDMLGGATLPYGEHSVRHILATQMVLELTRFTYTTPDRPTT